jgi:hypothetical protein
LHGLQPTPFFIGVLATATGIALSIRELAIALDPVKAGRAALPKE